MDDWDQLAEMIQEGEIASLDMNSIAHLLRGRQRAAKIAHVLSLLGTSVSLSSLDLWGVLRIPGSRPQGALVPGGTVDSPTSALNALLRANSTLRVLDIGGNAFGDDTCAALVGAMLDGLCVMERVVMSQNDLTDRSGAALARLIAQAGRLQHLELKRNRLGNVAAAAIASALAGNRSMLSLSLVQNSIGAKGGAALAASLETNTSLCALELKYNLLGKEGGHHTAINSRCQANATRGGFAPSRRATSLQLGQCRWRSDLTRGGYSLGELVVVSTMGTPLQISAAVAAGEAHARAKVRHTPASWHCR
jgi:hypothetical protein